MPFMTIPEAAVLWHISASELRQLCENREILGAVRVISAGLSRRTRPVLPKSFPYPEPCRRSFHGTNRSANPQQPDCRR